MSEHQDPQAPGTDQQTTLKRLRQVWIGMSRIDFDQMCVEQQLLSSDSRGQWNECYHDALRMYEYVQDQQFRRNHITEGYLERLEELRVAQIVVSADTFLRGREEGLVQNVPLYPSSYLAEFLDFNHNEAWTGFNKLVPAFEKLCAAIDSVVKEEGVSLDETRSLASAALSDLRETFVHVNQGKVLDEFINEYCGAVQGSLLREPIVRDDAMINRRIRASKRVKEYAQTLTGNSEASVSSGSSLRPHNLSATLRGSSS